MKKIYYIAILLFGILLMPSTAFACGSNSGKTSCSMEMSSKTNKKNCCSKDSHTNKEKQKSCNGKCGQGLCNANSSVNIAFNLNQAYDLQFAVFNFNTERQNFNTSVSFPSDGYSTIWLIPKIG